VTSPIRIFGILNLTTDSFSDGGRFLDPEQAATHAKRLHADGANVVDVGAAASNADAAPVSPAEEIARLSPVIDVLERERIPVSVDSFAPDVQRYALGRGVAFLNDVGGFAEPALYDALASSMAGLVVVHTLTGPHAAPRRTAAGEVRTSARRFFDDRIDTLTRAGVARERIWLDPGMGLFLGSGIEPSVEALRLIGELHEAYELPVLISVSRKGFLGEICQRGVADRGAATLAAELYAVDQGAAAIRTHEPGAIRDALRVRAALTGGC
jgi:dihydropteroate synthase type 2